MASTRAASSSFLAALSPISHYDYAGARIPDLLLARGYAILVAAHTPFSQCALSISNPQGSLVRRDAHDRPRCRRTQAKGRLSRGVWAVSYLLTQTAANIAEAHTASLSPLDAACPAVSSVPLPIIWLSAPPKSWRLDTIGLSVFSMPLRRVDRRMSV